MNATSARRTRTLAAALLPALAAAGVAAGPAPSPATQSPSPAALGSTATVDLVYSEPAPIRQIWQELGEQGGFQVVFAPHLADRMLAIDLRGATADEAVALLSAAAGHFTKPLASGALLVAADTPMNRRQYEEMLVRQFALEHVEIKDAMTLLRSLLDIRRLAVGDLQRSIVVRDIVPKVAAAGRLLELYDRPAAEVEVDVDWLTLEPSVLHELTAGSGDVSPVRVPAGRLSRLGGDPSAVRRLTTLSVVDGRRASYEAVGADTVPGATPADLELSVEPRVHRESGEITLELEAEAVHREGRGGASGTRQINSSLRLGGGETFLLIGLLPATPPASPGEGAGRVSLLAVTPRIVHPSGLRPADLEAVVIGTEVNIAAPEPEPEPEPEPDDGC